MHWEILIIPLIALGVWILGTVFKGEEERARGQGRRPGPGEGRPRRPVTDLDRFLEEARRRREGEKRPVPEQRPPARSVIARPSPVVVADRPLRVPRPAPAPPREMPQPTRRAEQLPPVIPMVLPAEPAPPLEATLVVPRPEPTPVGQVTAGAPAAPSPSRSHGPSPVLQQVWNLLNKPQTPGTAFVLREIFDRPLCKRRRS